MLSVSASLSFFFDRSGSGNRTVTTDVPPGCRRNVKATSSAALPFDSSSAGAPFGDGGFWFTRTFVMSANE